MILGIPAEYVPAPFKALVAAEIAEADRRARSLLPPKPRSLTALRASERPARTRVDPAELERASALRRERHLAGVCVGCGCDRDDRTRGCDQCAARHRARRASERGAPYRVDRVAA